ncbi:MAG: hypothetical protein LBS96_08970 [Oscillospiraceae bacterium]|jgi:hypothetical protein|nr:hypothetical protein [Oscillospiraceae bacterium]
MEKTLDNTTAREWYLAKLSSISEQINPALPLEERAKQAFDLRNMYRTQTRELMEDAEARERLDREKPNQTFEELVALKIAEKGYTREQALKYILESATRANIGVNRSLGL